MGMHLAIDMGSESGRAIVGWLEDGVLKTDLIHRFRTQFTRVHGKDYRNLYRFNDEIQYALSLYAEKYGPRLDSISVCSWGGDFAVLNRDGNLNHLPLSYRSIDSEERTKQLIEETFGERALYERNGNQRMPTDPLRLLLRMKLEDDPSLDDPHGMLFIADAMHYLLGAEACCERSMVTFGRLFDFRKDDWDWEVFERFGLPRGLCSRVVPPGTRIGEVDPAIVKAAGLQGPVPIVTSCTHDTACALTAVPDNGSGWAFISCGTWALMGMEVEAPVINDISYENNFNNTSVPFGRTMFKRNMTGTWIIEQCKQRWGRYSYDQIVDLAEAAEDSDLSIDINSRDFYDPEDMPAAISAALKRDFGAEVDPNDVATIAAVVYRSMALEFQRYLGALLRAAGRKIDRIYMLGGGSKNRLIAQYTANACGYRVYTGVFEGSSVGNLLLQAYACGELKDKEAMRRVSANTFPQTAYEPKDAEAWQRRYAIFAERVIRKNLW